MTEKRYYCKDYEELYYIFDSNTISEKEFDEKEKYEGYTAFEDSLTSEEIIKLLNENEELKQRNNRQYEQLGRLYDLIEQKEWRVLTDIIDDFKKSDEQLQKEWRTYGDVE